jgi:hypothetical protein
MGVRAGILFASTSRMLEVIAAEAIVGYALSSFKNLN